MKKMCGTWFLEIYVLRVTLGMATYKFQEMILVFVFVFMIFVMIRWRFIFDLFYEIFM